MKTATLTVLLAVSFCAAPSFLPLLDAQTCADEVAMVKDYQKSITDLVATVKKENLNDFENAYHQQSCVTKLTLCLSIVDGLCACLDKAAKDPATSKDQADADKAKFDSYTKLKAKLQPERDALKSSQNPKKAKSLVEKLDVSI